MTINIDSNIINKIKEYCILNNKDFDYELNDIIKIGFSIKKYGNSPFQKMKEQNGIKETNENNIEKNIEHTEESIDSFKENKINELKTDNSLDKPKKKIRIIKSK